jgi:translation initiation factor 1 (eIF-1/SUI1)
VTAIHGLEAFGACFLWTYILNLTRRCNTDVDLKKAAKLFAQKFATGASVTKNAQGLDEIVVQVRSSLHDCRLTLIILLQGDVSYDVEEMLTAPKGKDVPILKGIPEDNIELIEEKKKKPAADA